MSLFDKFAPLSNLRSDLLEHGILPFGVVTEKILSPTEGIVDGRRTILAGTNNYLGLTFAPECVEAARKAIHEVDYPKQTKGDIHMIPPAPEDAPPFVKEVVGEIIAGRGDKLPVSKLPDDGTYAIVASRAGGVQGDSVGNYNLRMETR